MSSFQRDFRAGIATIAPLLPPAATLSIAVGVASPPAGLSGLQALVMSVAVYFPSVMLTALELLETDVPVAVIVVTALVVGVRAVILSLSIAPYFRRFSTPWRWLLAYFLWTPVYALTIERFEADPTADVRGFYLGLAVPLWFTVHASVLVGVVFSARVPDGLELGFIVPLAFIALLMNFLGTRGGQVAAAVGGVTAVAWSGLPLGIGIVGATAVGTVAGAIVAVREVRR